MMDLQASVAPGISIIIPSAGRSRRMRGADKLLEPIDGEPLLRRTARSALASGAQEVVIVSRPEHDQRRHPLRDLPLRQIITPAARAGLGASIGSGVLAGKSNASGYLVLLADMPDIGPALIKRVMMHLHPARIVRPTDASGRGGHPVLFGRDFVPRLLQLKGDAPGRLLAEHPERVDGIVVAGRDPFTDLDTPEDWQDWQSR